MRILLIGEYSNVHWTLACGLRQLGHQVTVLSNGDFWKDYPLPRASSGLVGRPLLPYATLHLVATAAGL